MEDKRSFAGAIWKDVQKLSSYLLTTNRAEEHTRKLQELRNHPMYRTARRYESIPPQQIPSLDIILQQHQQREQQQ